MLHIGMGTIVYAMGWNPYLALALGCASGLGYYRLIQDTLGNIARQTDAAIVRGCRSDYFECAMGVNGS
jgi:hypothetical protein